MAFQRVRERGIFVVQISEVRAVDGKAGKDARGNRREKMAGVGERVRIGLMERDYFVAAGRVGDDPIGSADLIR